MRKVFAGRAFMVVVLLVSVLNAACAANLNEQLIDLKADEWQTRRNAVLAIGDMGDEAISHIPILQNMLDDEDRNVRWAAIQSLTKLGGENAVTALADAINHPQDDVRSLAVDALGKLGSDAESAVPALINILQTDDVTLKLAAITALGKIGPGAQTAVPELALLLGGEFRISISVKQAITKIDPKADVIDVLISAVESDDVLLAVRAATALGEMGSQASRSIPVLIQAVNAPEPEMRAAVASALGIMGADADEAIVKLAELLVDNMPEVRIAAVNALGTLKANADFVVPTLAKSLDDADLDVLKAVLRALRAYGIEAGTAAPQVALTLSCNDEVVLRMTKETLLEINPQFNSGQSLIKFTENDDEAIRRRAVAALTQLESVDDQILESLIHSLQDEVVGVRMQAAISLGEIGSDASTVVAALRQALDDDQWQVGWMAAVALSRIAPKTVVELIATLDEGHIPLLLEALMHHDPDLREGAANRLRVLAPQTNLVVLLRDALNDSNVPVRERAIVALGVLGTEIDEAFYGLILALEDSNKELSDIARETILGISGDDSVLSTLGMSLLQPDPVIQAAAHRLLLDAPMFAATMVHENMDMRIGWPATISLFEPSPTLKVVALRNGDLSVSVSINDVIVYSSKHNVTAGLEIAVDLLPEVNQLGTYSVKMTMTDHNGDIFVDRFYFTIFASDQLPSQSSKIAYLGEDDRMIYVPDYKGNRIPDFSHVGYMGGGVALPDVPVKVVLEPQPNDDDTQRIQAAIDQVSQLPLDQHGLRGAVLLKKGEYRAVNPIYIRASGVVLRGEGQNEATGTIIRATGTREYNLLHVGGSGSRQQVGQRVSIVENYVPVNATTFTISDASQFNVGDDIIVHRPSTKEWISHMGMDSGIMARPGVTPWQPGTFDHYFERKIVNIEGNTITIDVPIMQALEARFGGGEVYKFSWNGRIEQVGVENIRLVSDYAHSTDEEHGWRAIVVNNAQDGWVRDVTTQYFGQSTVYIQSGAKRVSIADSTCLDPISVMASPRRYSFDVNGALNLVMRCYSQNARHDFVLGPRTPGPNVFIDGVGKLSNSASEPHHRWSVGVLFDNIDVTGPNGLLVVGNRGDSGSGHGWSGGNVLFWNCRSAFIGVMQPPSAQNYAIGVSGIVKDVYASRVISNNVDWLNRRSGSNFVWEGIPFVGDGYYEAPDGPVAPRSLYLQQLQERLGEQALRNIGY